MCLERLKINLPLPRTHTEKLIWNSYFMSICTSTVKPAFILHCKHWIHFLPPKKPSPFHPKLVLLYSSSRQGSFILDQKLWGTVLALFSSGGISINNLLHLSTRFPLWSCLIYGGTTISKSILQTIQGDGSWGKKAFLFSSSPFRCLTWFPKYFLEYLQWHNWRGQLGVGEEDCTDFHWDTVSYSQSSWYGAMFWFVTKTVLYKLKTWRNLVLFQQNSRTSDPGIITF